MANLTQQGVHLQAEYDKLSVRSPKGVLTPEQRQELAVHKAEILAFLHEINRASDFNSVSLTQCLSLDTIGRLIGGFAEKLTAEYKRPIIEPRVMAQKLKVTFRPLPNGYQNQEVINFWEELKIKILSYGVKVEEWEQATKEYYYEINNPLIRWKKEVKTRIVKTGVNAVIDVERPSSLTRKLGTLVAELQYKIYAHFIAKGQKISVSTIVKMATWAEDHIGQRVEDPTNTQIISSWD